MMFTSLQSRLVSGYLASLTLHGGLGVVIALTPAFSTQPKEIASAVYLEDVGQGLPQGEQLDQLPSAAASPPTPEPMATQVDASAVVVPQPQPTQEVAPAKPKVAKELPQKQNKPLAKELPAKKVATLAKAEAAAPTTPNEKLTDVDSYAEELNVKSALERARTEKASDLEPATEEESPQVAETKPEPVAAPEPTPAATAVAESSAQEQPAPTAKSQVAAAQTSSTTNTVAPGSTTSQPYGIRDAEDLRPAPGNRPPSYPERDRLARNQGTVVFVARVRKDGTVTDIRTEQTSSSRSLDLAAWEAMKNWRFLPGQEGWVRKGFTFSLGGDAEEIPARLRR